MYLKEYLKVRPLSFSDTYKILKFFIKNKKEIKEDDKNFIKVKYNGLVWNLRYSMFDFDLGIVVGSHEKEVLKWVNFNEIETFIDAGAYIGTYTLRAALNGKVYAFEPNPYSFEILKNNIKANNLEDKVILYNGALSDKNGEVKLCIGNVGSSLVFNECKNSLTVKSITLDSLNVSTVDMIKIDVEGSELNVINGGLKTLNNTRSVFG
ncbi:MAG: FkbM family methyltransferase [Saccharolobus sp.]|uniref:FkbM family methyltransferase n=2 Tax=Sulfolobaceae TaxID=118883 RepID=UPI001F0E40DD|nr:FkbM family methyltransferase [Saccharolobus shibatae]MCH4816146.1 FkbM family methyltransferase [Saccharolobus shibatae]